MRGLALAAFSFSSVLMLRAATRIDDPKAFVTEVYRRITAAKSSGYNAPDDIYTPRLAKLIRDDRRKANGEEGCVGFDIWVNGQDWKIANLAITSTDEGQDRKMVVARFRNLGTAEEIHFDFRRSAGGWLLDEVESVAGERWTLSKLLQCAP